MLLEKWKILSHDNNKHRQFTRFKDRRVVATNVTLIAMLHMHCSADAALNHLFCPAQRNNVLAICDILLCYRLTVTEWRLWLRQLTSSGHGLSQNTPDDFDRVDREHMSPY